MRRLRHTVALNGKPVFTAEDYEYVDLCGAYATPDGVAVLFGAQESGSGGSPPDQLFFLLLRPKAKPQVVTDDAFNSPTRDLRVKVDGGKVLLDLGYEERKAKSAVLAGGLLAVKHAPLTQAVALDKDDCDFLYEFVNESCVPEEGVPEACASSESVYDFGFGIGPTMTFTSLQHHPGFQPKAFLQACVAHCKTDKAPAAPEFRRSSCGIKG